MDKLHWVLLVLSTGYVACIIKSTFYSFSLLTAEYKINGFYLYSKPFRIAASIWAGVFCFNSSIAIVFLQFNPRWRTDKYNKLKQEQNLVEFTNMLGDLGYEVKQLSTESLENMALNSRKKESLN